MISRTFTRGLLRANSKLWTKQPIKTAVCIDIECTCDSPIQIQPMEIIEIACVKLDLMNNKGGDAKTNDTNFNEKDNSRNRSDATNNCPLFHSFVRPKFNPKLTLFCQDLTGITQQIVDRSDDIDHVIRQLIQWLGEQELIDNNLEKNEHFAFASCGNLDLNLLAPIIRNCNNLSNNLDLPIYFREWINVKKTFVNHRREWPKGLYHMLEMLGEEPSGMLHSAKDDCKNLARVVECLHLEGCRFYVTNRMQ